jgi:hypothetical protein
MDCELPNLKSIPFSFSDVDLGKRLNLFSSANLDCDDSQFYTDKLFSFFATEKRRIFFAIFVRTFLVKVEKTFG